MIKLRNIINEIQVNNMKTQSNEIYQVLKDLYAEIVYNGDDNTWFKIINDLRSILGVKLERIFDSEAYSLKNKHIEALISGNGVNEVYYKFIPQIKKYLDGRN